MLVNPLSSHLSVVTMPPCVRIEEVLSVVITLRLLTCNCAVESNLLNVPVTLECHNVQEKESGRRKAKKKRDTRVSFISLRGGKIKSGIKTVAMKYSVFRIPSYIRIIVHLLVSEM